MGEKIEFPLNNQRYFEQAAQLLEKNEYNQALDYLEKIFQTNQSIQVTQLYTLVLYTLERYEEALETANHQKDFYMKEDKEAVFYTILLIKNHLFLEAEVLVNNHLSNTHSPYFEEWQYAQRELVIERENVQFQMELQIKETKQALHELHSYAPAEQTKIIQNARQLNLDVLQQSAQTIFMNPQVLPATQKAFLELLIEKQDPNKYMFQGLDGPREIIPKQLKTFDQLNIISQLTDVLESKLEKNPSGKAIVETEIINDLLLLYPFAEEIITDADFWIDHYLQVLGFKDAETFEENSLSQEEKQMKKWLDYLNHMALRNT